MTAFAQTINTRSKKYFVRKYPKQITGKYFMAEIF